MPLREKIRAAVRRFLGLDDLATKTNLGNLIKMLQTDQRALNERLEHIENLLQARPAPQRQAVAAFRVVDWDQAQAMALASLDSDPTKEN